jgi:hypothetical protein
MDGKADSTCPCDAAGLGAAGGTVGAGGDGVGWTLGCQCSSLRTVKSIGSLDAAATGASPSSLERLRTSSVTNFWRAATACKAVLPSAAADATALFASAREDGLESAGKSFACSVPEATDPSSRILSLLASLFVSALDPDPIRGAEIGLDGTPLPGLCTNDMPQVDQMKRFEM